MTLTDPDGKHPLLVAVLMIGGRQVIIYYAKKQIKKQIRKQALRYVKKRVKKGIKTVKIDNNKLKHIFGKPQHKLDKF